MSEQFSNQVDQCSMLLPAAERLTNLLVGEFESETHALSELDGLKARLADVARQIWANLGDPAIQIRANIDSHSGLEDGCQASLSQTVASDSVAPVASAVLVSKSKADELHQLPVSKAVELPLLNGASLSIPCRLDEQIVGLQRLQRDLANEASTAVAEISRYLHSSQTRPISKRFQASIYLHHLLKLYISYIQWM
ncbi:unnamed protein product [Protopolystoma xenopodis]|uniref:Uncharacterized protein n=1 Tax=Protopolystoma xenopodis TaxID=117903 RepID=A0A448WP01_9PLAT|nr:unnamed protein product [Protopolystoma xenopodis]